MFERYIYDGIRTLRIRGMLNLHFRSTSTLVRSTVASKLDVSHVSCVCTSFRVSSMVRLLLTTSRPLSGSVLVHPGVVRGRSLRYHVTRGRGLPARRTRTQASSLKRPVRSRTSLRPGQPLEVINLLDLAVAEGRKQTDGRLDHKMLRIANLQKDRAVKFLSLFSYLVHIAIGLLSPPWSKDKI